MARNDAATSDRQLLLKRNDELTSRVNQLERELGKLDAVVEEVKRQRRRIRPIAHEFFGELNLQRSPYRCSCGKLDHRAIWVNKKLHCPMTVICKVGILELRGLNKVPIDKIIELSKI